MDDTQGILDTLSNASTSLLQALGMAAYRTLCDTQPHVSRGTKLRCMVDHLCTKGRLGV